MEEKVAVELLTRHEHAGQVKNVGDVIDLYPDQANILIGQGVAKKISPSRAPVRGTSDKKQPI